VVVGKPKAKRTVRMSSAKVNEAVETLGTPSATVPSASNKPRMNAA